MGLVTPDLLIYIRFMRSQFTRSFVLFSYKCSCVTVTNIGRTSPRCRPDSCDPHYESVQCNEQARERESTSCLGTTCPSAFSGGPPLLMRLVSVALYPIRGNRHIIPSPKTYEMYMRSGCNRRDREGTGYRSKKSGGITNLKQYKGRGCSYSGEKSNGSRNERGGGKSRTDHI